MSKRDDALLVLSYTGNNEVVIRQLEEIFAIATPTIISITRADNNVIQNMSDLNFTCSPTKCSTWTRT